MREKLIELVEAAHNAVPLEYVDDETKTLRDCIAAEADYLLAHGVIVLPCKVGDTVWRVSTKHISKVKYIEKTKVSRIAVDDAIWLFCECAPIARCTFGKTVFLTREEAEAALKPKVDLADVVDIDKQNKDSNAAMRKVIDFVTEGLE